MHRRHRVPGIGQVRAPSWAASSPNPAASTVGSSAGNCQATPTSARCRCAYSTATLVLPAPPSPHNATIRGPVTLSPASRASSSASSSSRPARTTGRGGSRTGFLGTCGPPPERASAVTRLTTWASIPSSLWPCRWVMS